MKTRFKLHNWIQTRVLLQYSQDNFWTCNFHDFTTGNLTSLSFCRCWPIDLGWSHFVQIQENLISDHKVYMLQLNYRRINLITGFDLYSACCRLSNSRVVEKTKWSKKILMSNTCIWERGEWHMFGRVFLHYVQLLQLHNNCKLSLSMEIDFIIFIRQG